MNEIFKKEKRAGALETQMQARMKRLYEDAPGTEEVALRDENVKHFNLGANRYQMENLLQRICLQLITAEAVIQKECSPDWKLVKVQILRST